MTKSDHDYIVVGAGSAGCIVADRLTEDRQHSVLLLEAGGSDASLFIRMPTALSYPMNSATYDWQFASQPEPGLDGRSLHCPRGKVLGGSSSINGMVYVRGNARDFDGWAQQGARDWDYQHCLPYFKRNETWIDGADPYRGDSGPVGTCNGNRMLFSPLYNAFLTAGEQAGYGRTRDYNGFQQEGFGPMHMTVKDGVRSSTARAYLRRARKRPQLQVVTHALARRVVFEGRQAVGVEYERGGKVVVARARKEVVLCAGAVGSPVLLQASGVGPQQVVRDAGVDVVHHLNGVGENLQDHLEVYFQYHCKQPVTLNSRLGLLSKAMIGARWLLFKDGLGSTNHFEACAFIRSRAGRQWPDIQYHFLPAAMRYDGHAAVDGHAFQAHVGPTRSKSRGRIRIRSADAAAKPDILFNYLQHEDDSKEWRCAIRLTREIFAQPCMDTFRGQEIQPGEGVQSDAEIDAWVKHNVESAYHPSGTCKMGAADDDSAVVDPHCRVRGLSGLRVVDSSIFPVIPNGNLNAPTMMVAERASDMLLQRTLLAPADVPYWSEPQWETRQRPGTPLRAVDGAI